MSPPPSQLCRLQYAFSYFETFWFTFSTTLIIYMCLFQRGAWKVSYFSVVSRQRLRNTFETDSSCHASTDFCHSHESWVAQSDDVAMHMSGFGLMSVRFTAWRLDHWNFVLHFQWVESSTCTFTFNPRMPPFLLTWFRSLHLFLVVVA